VLSDMVTMCGGTPQGTLLGPLVFIIHLGDFHISCLVEDFIYYVDDTSLCHALKDPRDDHLQRARPIAPSTGQTPLI